MSRKTPADLTEKEHINELLKGARRHCRATTYKFEADWLLSGGIGSKTWTVLVNHDSNTTLTVQFDHFLPDGSLLTDPQNSLLLIPIQKAAFHLKAGHIADFHGGYKQWIRVIDTSVNLARWLVLHTEIFQTSQYGFSLLTDNHLTAYFYEFAGGGIVNTLKIDDRLLITLHENTKSLALIPELLANKNSLNEDFIIESAKWLNSQGAYCYSKRYKVKRVSRKYLESTLGCSFQLFDIQPAIANIINQLSIEHLPSTPEVILLAPICSRRITPVTPIVKRTMDTHRREIKTFTSTHKLISEIPFFAESTFNETHLDKLGLDGHTRLIPLEAGLEAINRAAEMIVCFGEQIVETALLFAEHYTETRKNYSQTTCNALMKSIFENKKLNWPSNAEFGSTTLLTRYNVTSFTSDVKTWSIESGITFKTLHQAFYGACALLIGMCKPIREGELYNLNFDCLHSEFEGGGAELVQVLEKSGLLGELQTITRPIPSLVARAIQLLQVLAAKLKKIYRDETGPLSNHLFYIPARYVSAPNGKSLRHTLNAAIDTFCLITELPKEPNGQNRKIRIHEMRKFFLLVMYSHHEGSLRRTLSYAAGHIREDQIDSYISFSHDDPERVKYESQCISDRLISLERGCTPSKGNDGLCALYNYVCSHFNVHTIQSLSHEKFIQFLNLVQRSGRYKSTLYSIEMLAPSGILTALDFAIKFEGQQDDEYY